MSLTVPAAPASEPRESLTCGQAASAHALCRASRASEKCPPSGENHGIRPTLAISPTLATECGVGDAGQPTLATECGVGDAGQPTLSTGCGLGDVAPRVQASSMSSWYSWFQMSSTPSGRISTRSGFSDCTAPGSCETSTTAPS